MTVSLRQTKKFLTRHKLLMTLRARDIFKISHASLLLSPRFDRDLCPSFLADNFQRIDARQHFVRDRQPFGKRFAHRLGAVEAGLGRYVALGRAGIERRSAWKRVAKAKSTSRSSNMSTSSSNTKACLISKKPLSAATAAVLPCPSTVLRIWM